MKILLLGKNGQVGWELQRSLAPLGEVLALDRNSTSYCGDLNQPDAVAQTVRQWRPDVIVNAAAYTAVDKAETDKETAHRINALAPAAIASAASEINACFIHYSTDYVFDGSGTQAWTETDDVNPQNEYGRSKWLGEQAIAESGVKHLIFRTSWVYAARGANFAKTMLRLAQEREQLKVVSDQVGAPTSAELIADVSAHAIKSFLKNKADVSGVYHLVASGETSWFEYARHVIVTAQGLRPDMNWKVAEILPIASTAFPTPAKRPLNSRLQTSKLQQTFALTLPHWSQGVDRMLCELLTP